MPRHVLRFTLVTGAIVAAACVEYAPVTPTASTATMPAAGSPSLQLVAPLANGKSYLINFTGTQLPADLDAQVAAAGGALTTRFSQIGVALASSSDPRFAARAGQIKGVATVNEDIDVQWVKPDRVTEAGEVSQDIVVTPDASFGNAETFRRIQWAPDAVHAPAAWDAGSRGAGARVAVLDGGIRSTHIDIAPRLDVAHSVSFVPN